MNIPFNNNVYCEEKISEVVIPTKLMLTINDFCCINNATKEDVFIGAFASFLAKYNFGKCYFRFKNLYEQNDDVLFDARQGIIDGDFACFVHNIGLYSRPSNEELGYSDVLLVLSNENENEYLLGSSKICLKIILGNEDIRLCIETNQRNIRLKSLLTEYINYLKELVITNIITNDKSIYLLISSSIEKYYFKESIEKLFSCYHYSIKVIDDISEANKGFEIVHIILYSLWDVVDDNRNMTDNCKAFQLYNNSFFQNVKCKTIVVLLSGLKNMNCSKEVDSKVKYHESEFVDRCKMFGFSILDFSNYRKSDIYEHFLYEIANIPYKKVFFNTVARETVRGYFTSIGKGYKLIVLDGDETLWDGIISDDGLDNINVGYKKQIFQKKLKELKEKGLMLAICSKNNIEDINALFEKNTQMALKKEDFISIVANFDSKSKNTLYICEKYSVDLNAVIFIDDSMYECGELMRNIPEVTVLPYLNEYDMGSIVQSLVPIHNLVLTLEDALRTQSMHNQIDNVHLINKKTFWNELNATYLFSYPEIEDIPRIVQLNSRVNRFRLSLDELNIDTISSRSRKRESFIIRVNDKFGDYGIVSYISWCVYGEEVTIDNWIMSCRLSVEYAEHVIWNYLLDYFNNMGIKNVKVRYQDTGKNVRFRQFCSILGFFAKGSYLLCNIDHYSNQYKDVCVDCKLEKYRNKHKKNVTLFNAEEEFNVTEFNVSQNLYEASESNNSKNAWIFLNNKHLLQSCNDESDIILTKIRLLDDDKEKLIKLWESILHCKITDYSKSFICYGGNSILYMELIALVVQLWNIDICQMPFRLDNNILEHESLIKAYKNSRKTPMIKMEKTEFVVPSFSERFFNYKNNSIALHIPIVISINFDTDKQAIEEKITQIMNKYRIFRSAFKFNKGKIVVSILEQIHVEVCEHVINSDVLDAKYLDDIIRKFNFQKPPLVHLDMIHCNERKYLVIDFCHIIVDGMSALRMTDIIYDALTKNSVEEEINSENYDFYDYCHMYEERIIKNNYLKDREYWLKELKSLDSSFELPIIYRKSDDTRPVRIDISRNVIEDIESVCRKRGITEFSFFLSTYTAFLHVLLCKEDIAIGIPVNCKYSVDSKKDIGQYVNTVVFRSVLTDGENTEISNFFDKCNEKYIEDLNHSSIMLQDVSRIIESSYGYRNLFDTIFVYENARTLKAERFSYYQNSYKSFLDMNVLRSKDGATLQTNYNPSRISYKYIERITQYYYDYICQIVHILKNDIENVKLPNDLGSKNDVRCGKQKIMAEGTIIDCFIDIAKKYANNTCLIINDKRYTYQMVNNATNKFASKIVSRIGNKQRKILVICDNPELNAFSVLSVMKSGNVYIPVSPLSPKNRIEEIIEKCNVVSYIAEKKRDWIKQEFIRFEINCKSECENVNNTNIFDNAYIIYTSGTTGISKGVMIKHIGLVNAVKSRNEILVLDNNDNTVLLMGAASDGFFTSFFSPLIAGAQLYIPASIFEIKKIIDIIRMKNLKTFLCTPTMYNSILNLSNKGLLNKIRMVSLAGEAISESLVERSRNLYPNLELANEYGPTENSICTSINREIEHRDVISAGHLINNVNAVIKNKNSRICPDYVIGELELSGIGLSSGYVGDECPASKFSLWKGEIWYKTGDLAYWDEKDNLYIVGRNDSQVKVNGYRVDLIEIQNALLKYPYIEACTVLYEECKSLVVYYISEFSLSKSDIMQYLSNKLNWYMVPSQYRRVSRIPLTELGKINEKLLQEYLIVEDTNIVSDLEEKIDLNIVEQIRKIFSELLKTDSISNDTDFFEAGGNSLECVLLVEELREKLSVDLELDDIRLNPTPKMLAIQITSKDTVVAKCNELKPFNKFWFIDCYYTSILAILERYNRPISRFIRSFYIQGLEKEGEYKYKYSFIGDLGQIMEELSIKYYDDIFDNDFDYKVSRLLIKGYPVIVHVDCYYLPYCSEYFEKKHCDHVLTITKYDKSDNTFEILDQKNMDSVSFCVYIIKHDDLLNAVNGGILNRDSFNNVDYVSLVPYSTYVDMHKPLPRTQFCEVVKMTIKYLNENPKMVNIVVERLLNYIAIEKEISRYEMNDAVLHNLENFEVRLKRLLMSFINEQYKKEQSQEVLNLLRAIL